MRRRLAAAFIAGAVAGAALFGLWHGRNRAWPHRPAVRPPAHTAATLPPALPDSTFVRLVTSFSEDGGYFDTDNLISNESSYLHVIGGLRQLGVQGGAYLGVGPDQNFSYIAAIHPRIAFIVDIRRDNMLEHLLFKVLFEQAPTRVEYLSLLFARQPPDDPADWADRSIDELVEYIQNAPAGRERLYRTQRALVERVADSGIPLSTNDLAVIARIYAAFAIAGPSLRYNSHGRAPRPSYPTYRQLLAGTDLDGYQANFLAHEADYAFVRALEQRNLIVPVTGDFAGEHALRAIGRYLDDAGLTVSAFYLSNVEFYLWQDHVFNTFAVNVKGLPFDGRSVLIRSLFGRIYDHPQSVPGYNSTQLMQPIGDFVRAFEEGEYRTYGDLVYRGYVELR